MFTIMIDGLQGYKAFFLPKILGIFRTPNKKENFLWGKFKAREVWLNWTKENSDQWRI